MFHELISPVPRGTGGLKSIRGEYYDLRNGSRPARDGWIEILYGLLLVYAAGKSRPARDGWIEIPYSAFLLLLSEVPSREGRVD